MALSSITPIQASPGARGRGGGSLHRRTVTAREPSFCSCNAFVAGATKRREERRDEGEESVRDDLAFSWGVLRGVDGVDGVVEGLER